MRFQNQKNLQSKFLWSKLSWSITCQLFCVIWNSMITHTQPKIKAEGGGRNADDCISIVVQQFGLQIFSQTENGTIRRSQWLHLCAVGVEKLNIIGIRGSNDDTNKKLEWKLKGWLFFCCSGISVWRSDTLKSTDTKRERNSESEGRLCLDQKQNCTWMHRKN